MLTNSFELTVLDLEPFSLASYEGPFDRLSDRFPCGFHDILFSRTLPQSWACVSLRHLLALCCIHWQVPLCRQSIGPFTAVAEHVLFCLCNQQYAVTNAQLLR